MQKDAATILRNEDSLKIFTRCVCHTDMRISADYSSPSPQDRKACSRPELQIQRIRANGVGVRAQVRCQQRLKQRASSQPMLTIPHTYLFRPPLLRGAHLTHLH
eukprot:1151420-Pleurochrysis_carterae.AAC.1